MVINSNIELNPSLYFNSVKEFHKRYSIPIDKPSFDLLQEILLYFSRIPYENMSKIIKLSQKFDDPLKIRFPDEVLEDHFRYNLGGTCFAITFLLKTILTFHGYNCYIVMADMKWGTNIHCAIILVHNSQPYLIDPGYLLHHPLPLPKKQPVIVKTPYAGIKLSWDRINKVYNLHTFNCDDIKWRYKFINKPVPKHVFVDFWLSSFQWNSMNAICIATVRENKMIYIHKDFMRKTNYNEKKNYNLKNNYLQTISHLLEIDHLKIEEALEALGRNRKIKAERGLWKPKSG